MFRNKIYKMFQNTKLTKFFITQILQNIFHYTKFFTTQNLQNISKHNTQYFIVRNVQNVSKHKKFTPYLKQKQGYIDTKT